MKIFRESFEPFLKELTGGNRWLHIAFIGLAILFLGYNYLVKEPFLRSNGHGIPALVSGEQKAQDIRKEIRDLEKDFESNAFASDEERQASRERLEALRVCKEQDDAKNSDPDSVPRTTVMYYLRYAGWFVGTFVFLFVLPVIFIALHPRLRLRDFGLGLGDWRFAGKIAIIFFGVMAIAVFCIVLFNVKSFLAYYPLYAQKGVTGPQPDFLFWFLILEFCFLLYFIGWEFFFRSLILFPLEKYLGGASAVIGLLPFALTHIGKPVVEVFGSILAAWLLSVLVLRVRSFWICPLLHFAVSCTMNLVAVFSRQLF
jgi:hypothetical protein